MVVCDLLPFLIPSTHRASRLRYSPATTNTPAAANTANAQPKKGFSFCRPLFYWLVVANLFGRQNAKVSVVSPVSYLV